VFKLGKKAMMGGGMMGPRKPISLILGFAFLAFGLIPLLKQMGTIGFTIPDFGNTVLHILSIFGAVLLLWDAIAENMGMMGMSQMIRMATFVMALVLLAVGLIPILHSMGAIGFTIPAMAETVMNVLYVITGVLLFYGGTQGM